MHKSRTYHNDSGHGWLEVPKADLEQLGIAGKISPFSYQDTESAYLEEDLDAGVYLRAAREAGWYVETTDRYVNGESFVRNLPLYKA